MNDEPSTADHHDTATAGTGATADAEDCLHFADFVFDQRRAELRRAGAVVPLRPKPLTLLRYFLAHPQRLLGKPELLAAVWTNTVVTDDSLVQCVGELRAALGPRGATLIVTQPRRGYLFDAEVRVGPDAAAASASPQPSPVLAPPSPPIPDAQRGDEGWRTWRRPRWIALGAGMLALTCGAAIYVASDAPEDIDQELARRQAIGILAFPDIGEPPLPSSVREGFGAEMAAAIAARGDMLAITGASSHAARGARPDIAGAVGETQARYLLGGNMMRRGEGGLTLRAQLTRVADNTVVWSDRYDYDTVPSDRVAEIQIETARRILAGLTYRLSQLNKARMSVAGYRPDGVDLVILGYEDIIGRQTLEDVERGKRRLQEALKRDPRSIQALNGLTAALMSERYGYSGEPLPKDLGESERMALTAVRLAPNDSIALINWGNVLLFRKQADQALAVLEKATRVSPTNPNAHMRYAAVRIFNGDTAGARASIGTAMKLGSTDPRATAAGYSLLAEVAFAEGDDAQAYRLAQRSVADRPTYGRSYLTMAAIDALHGRDAQAAANLALHRKLMPFNTVQRFITNNPAIEPGAVASRERMVVGIRRAGLPE